MSSTKSAPSTETDQQTAAPEVPATAHASASDAPPIVAHVSAAELAASGALDTLFVQIDSGRVQRSGAGGLFPS